MDKCECWGNLLTWQYCDGASKICSCGGNKSKCDFYPEKRKEGKMNTAEMWLKAQKDGMCYEAVEQGPDTVILYYQKDKGLFDEDGMRCGPEIWNYFDDLMNDQWKLRTMTKSEAEAKFNIKIVGD